MSAQNDYQGAGYNMAADAFSLRYDPYESAMPMENHGDDYAWFSAYPSFDSSLPVGDFNFGTNDTTWPATMPAWQPEPSYSIYPEEPLLPVGTDFSFQPSYIGYPSTYPPPSPPLQPANAGAKLTARRSEKSSQQDTDYFSPAATPKMPPRRAPQLRRKSKYQRRKMNAAAQEPVKLEGPLSTLVPDSSAIDAEVEAYVSRSAEVRLQEVSGYKDGRIRRPLNAFMLYRKSYQGPAKLWSDESNHQNISKTCGASWRMETPQVRDRFAAFAAMELDNHRLAFPDYKYTPRKYEGTALDFD
ncbi:hypothetical protein F4809DRAFT_661726 [Biscogniauxia mediterranea]|nr:hypothetical protein F4809DRAFT_661726 [Biscogniauxia mediterranea]